MDDFFYTSDPWSAFYHHPVYSQPPAYARRRPFMSPVASPSRTERRPVASPAPSPAPARKPRVLSIPVRCVEVQGGDDRGAASATVKMGLAPSEAATRIQKAFRGFFVRRMTERVSQIASEVDAIEGMMASEAERNKIRSEPRERLRVGETLMALLLRLDSVLGVREYRRKVIRRVIRLQEMVDSIPAEDQMPDAPIQTADETVDKERSSDDEALEEQESKTAVAESADAAPIRDTTREEETVDAPQESKAEEMIQREDHSDAVDEEEVAQENQSEVALEAAESEYGTSKMEACEEKYAFNDELDDFVVVPMDEDFHSSSAPAGPETTANKDSVTRDTVPPEPKESSIAPAMVAKNSGSVGEMEVVVEKVMAESEKLQRLVATLCERNAQQCQLIAGLVSRVDRLEQTVHKMESKRKKKKKRLANNNLLSSPVGKKNNKDKDGMMSQLML